MCQLDETSGNQKKLSYSIITKVVLLFSSWNLELKILISLIFIYVTWLTKKNEIVSFNHQIIRKLKSQHKFYQRENKIKIIHQLICSNKNITWDSCTLTGAYSGESQHHEHKDMSCHVCSAPLTDRAGCLTPRTYIRTDLANRMRNRKPTQPYLLYLNNIKIYSLLYNGLYILINQFYYF